jgi:hypothetical protein
MNSRVWNRGKSDYSEKFKNRIISIPAGKFVVMGTYDAAQFRGSYPGKGVEKIIEVEDLPDKGKDQEEEIICHSCGRTFGTFDLLNAHLAVHNPQRIKEDEGDSELVTVTGKVETAHPRQKHQQVHKGWPKGVRRTKNGVENDTSTDIANNQGSGK